MKEKTNSERAADNRKMVQAFKDAWDSLNAKAQTKVASVAYFMLPEIGKGMMDEKRPVMDQPMWRHLCYAIIENLGLVRGRPHLWQSFIGIIVDESYWEQFGDTCDNRVDAVNRIFRSEAR